MRVLNGTVDIVIDVGVRQGTRDLYDALPETRFVLVDPQLEGEKSIKHRPQNFVFVNKALGSSKGQAEIRESGAKSTFHKRTALTAVPAETYRIVDIDTIDNLIDDLNLNGRIGIKLDTEGHEIEIIRGLSKHLDRVDFIICEASIRRRFEDSYNFSEIVIECYKRGFQFYNFASPPVPAPRYYDVIFLRVGHVLFG